MRIEEREWVVGMTGRRGAETRGLGRHGVKE
jgi:hypothetical protein